MHICMYMYVYLHSWCGANLFLRATAANRIKCAHAIKICRNVANQFLELKLANFKKLLLLFQNKKKR